jgi:hypothetical protein
VHLLKRFGAALIVAATLVAASPAAARVVRMQTVVSLTDQSDPAIKQALREAFDTSVRGAVAMGFSSIRVDGVQVLPHVVILATVATDDGDEDSAFDPASDQ